MLKGKTAPLPTTPTEPLETIAETSAETQPAPSAAHQAFSEQFPLGTRSIWVSGEGLLCGLRAVRESIRYQLPDHRLPSLETLGEIFTSSEVQGELEALAQAAADQGDMEQAAEFSNTDNFFVD